MSTNSTKGANKKTKQVFVSPSWPTKPDSNGNASDPIQLALKLRVFSFLEEREGFEHPDLLQPSVFKTDAIDQLCHLSKFPHHEITDE